MAIDLSEVDLTAYLEAKGAEHDDYDRAAILAAQDMVREGELEVDEITITSRGDDSKGCYVLAWIWVDLDQIESTCKSDPLHDEDEADDAENEVDA